MAASHEELAPGSRVDRYEVLEALGRGGFGAVYRARHLHLDRLVALKVLHPAHVESPEVVERFFREARAAAAAGSPHIVRVLDCGLAAGGRPFLAMELLAGEPLDRLLGREAPLAVERAVSLALQILDGLAVAHGAGVVHRDLKPGNVFVTRDAQTGEELAKLLDFGVSKVQQGALDRALTCTGAWLGTPRYMAPEQLGAARDVDHRADLYAVAVVLFQMVSGRLPVEARTPAELVYRVTSEPATPAAVAAPRLGPALGAVVDRGLARDPDARWPDAIAFGAALRGALGGSPAHGPGEPDASSVTRASPGSAPPVPGSAPRASSPATVVPATVLVASRAARGAGRARGGPRRRGTFAALAAAFGAAGLLGGAAVAAGLLAAAGSFRAPGSERAGAEPPGPAPVAAPPVVAAPPLPPPPVSPPPSPPAEPGAPAVPAVPAPTPVAATAPSEPAAPAGAEGGVRTGGLRVVGQLDQAALEELLARARPGMARCRRPGERVQVRIQAHVGPSWASGGRIALAGPAPDGSGGPEQVARCCASALAPAVPQGWSPGESGIFSFDVTLE